MDFLRTDIKMIETSKKTKMNKQKPEKQSDNNRGTIWAE